MAKADYLQILREELVPALGCTEPIALAYGAAECRRILGMAPERIEARCSGNIVKNVKGVVVPNCGGLKGIEAAVVAGALYGDAGRGLEVLSSISDDDAAALPERIREICAPLFEQYGVRYAYLFGSYAKGKATEQSDVDLLISMPLNGLRFYELVETLRGSLKKKVDLLDESQLENNGALVREILREGIKIYG